MSEMKVVIEGKIAEDIIEKATIRDEKLQVAIKPVLIDYSAFTTSDLNQSIDNMVPLYTNIFKGAIVKAKNQRIVAIDSTPPNIWDCEIIAEQLNAYSTVDMDDDEEILKTLTEKPFNYTKEEAEKILNKILNCVESSVSELLIITAPITNA